MNGRRAAAPAATAVAAAAAAVLGAACENKRVRPAASGSAGAGSGSGGSAGAPAAATGSAEDSPSSAEVARLPGVLWFVQDRPSHRLVRLAGGARLEVTTPGGDLFPSGTALPDGRLVAIASRGDGSPGSEQVALVGPDGAVERIGPTGAMVRSPAVDPRGRWIAIAANLDGHSDLYRLELPPARAAAPGSLPRLTTDPQGNFEPALLGDSALAFTSSRDGDSEIYRMPAAGGRAQRLTAFHRDDWGPVPSPDGAAIAFLSDREGRPRIFLMAADGTGARRLTGRTDADRDESSPVWSPDGRSIAYLVEGGGEATLWLRDVASGRERLLTPLHARDAEPCFSPDGAWLAVSRGRTAHDGDIWVIPVPRSTAGAGADPAAAPAPPGPALRVTATPGLERLPRWVR